MGVPYDTNDLSEGTIFSAAAVGSATTHDYERGSIA